MGGGEDADENEGRERVRRMREDSSAVVGRSMLRGCVGAYSWERKSRKGRPSGKKGLLYMAAGYSCTHESRAQIRFN